MRKTDLPYLGGFVTAALYALWLERRPLKYHPDVTWPNVTGGVALTGLWVAARIACGVPAGLTPQQAAAWAWWVTFRMFWATGVPVVAWELWAKGGRARRLVAYIREDRDGYEAPPAR